MIGHLRHRKMTLLKVLIITVSLIGMVFSSFNFAAAEPTYTINYQGKLTDTSGMAVTDGTYNMRFWLLQSDVQATTSAIWTETRTGADKVTVTNGLFSVMLGEVTSLASVDFNQPLYLGVEIGGSGSVTWDGEMLPRKQLGTVPSAFEANKLGGVASTSFLRSDAADTASGLLTFTGGVISSASSSIANLTTLTATTTNLVVNGERFTDLTGTGLTNTAGVLSVNVSALDAFFASTTDFDTSAELAAILSDETGTAGSVVFSESPTIQGGANINGGEMNLGTAGVRLSTDGDGAITFLGLGNGTDEDLTINLDDTSNTIAFSSGSGVTVNTFTMALDSASYVDADNYRIDGTLIINNNLTSDSVMIGELAGATITNNTAYNVALGFEAGRYASTSFADYNNYIGRASGYNNIGSENNLFGVSAGYNNTGNESNIIGYQAGYSNTGFGNNLFGVSAGYNNSGSQTNIIGYQAGYSNTGDDNNLLGRSAGYANMGSENNLIGFGAGFANTGSYNNFFGTSAGTNNTGSYNELIGYQTGLQLRATNTVAIGSGALLGNNGGGTKAVFSAINNVALGYRAGYNATNSADNNILIGYQAADNLTTGNNNIIIGYDIDSPTATADNILNIGNVIFGTGLDGTGTTLSSGNIGIGTSTPPYKLSVMGTAGFSDSVAIGPYAQLGFPVSELLNVAGSVTDDSGYTNLRSNIYAAPSDSPNDNLTAINAAVYTSNGADYTSAVEGINTGVIHQGTGTMAYAAGVTSYVGSYAAGTTTEAYGFAANIAAMNGGHIANSYGIAVGTPTIQSGGSIANAYGVYIESQGTDEYNIYSAGSATRNLFEGSVYLGAAGVQLSHDGDGALTLTGMGDGFDESLTLNLDDSNNLGQVTSASGLNVINFSGIALQEGGSHVLSVSELDTCAEFAALGALETGTCGSVVLSTSPTFSTSIIIGNAGVSITEDGDGAITFLGRGNGSDENLTLNLDDTANTGVFTSSTGLNQLTFTSIGLDTEYINTAIGATSTFDGDIAMNTVRLFSSSFSNPFLYVGQAGFGGGNTAVGAESLPYAQIYSYPSLARNTVMGSWAATVLIEGTDNTALGGATLGMMATGSSNTAIGSNALYSLTEGYANTALGTNAGGGLLDLGISFSSSTFIGYGAGYNATSGASSNILIGYQAADNLTTGNNNIIIGYDVDAVSSTTDNALNIGNLIFGHGLDGTGTTLASGGVSIGTTSERARLTVAQAPISYGAELITNGTFTGNANGWTLVADCSEYGSNKVTVSLDAGCQAGAYEANLQTDFDVEAGTTYKITFTISDVSGDAPYINLVYHTNLYTDSIEPYQNGTHVVYFTASTTATETLFIESYDYVNNGTWAIDDVSVVAVNETPALAVTNNEGTALITINEILQNVAFGRSGFENNRSYANTLMGYEVGSAITTGSYNAFFGNQAGYFNTSGEANIFIGTQAGYLNKRASGNIFIGYQAGYNNDSAAGGTATANVFVGNSAGYANTTGRLNTFMGNSAGSANTTGEQNLIIGARSGIAASTAWNNTFLGFEAGWNTTGANNTFVGSQAGDRNANGQYNVYVGGSAGFFNQGGTANVAVGYNAGDGSSGQTFASSTILGYGAGTALTTGGRNILLGFQAGNALTTGANNIVIGYDIDATSNTGSNQLNIGNILIGTGVNTTGTTIDTDALIAIGDSSPDARFDVDYTLTATAAATSYGTYFTVTDTGVVTTGTDNTYGNRVDVTRSGATGGTLVNYGGYTSLNGTFASGSGTLTNYGQYITVTGSSAGASTNYGLYVNVASADTNYAGIFTGGNVGIGTSTPEFALNVYGTDTVAQISGAGWHTGLSIRNLNTGGRDWRFISTSNSESMGGGKLSFYDASGSGHLMVLTSAGRLGIGTTSPWKTLSVSGDAHFTGALFDSSGDAGINGQVLLSTGTGMNWVSTSSLGISGSGGMSVGSAVTSGTNGSVLFVDGGNLAQDNANFYFNNSTNRLGLGTSTPGAALTVVSADTGVAHFISDDADGGISVNGNGSNVGSQGIFANAGDLYLTTEATERLRINSAGNVSIAKKLTVSGTGNSLDAAIEIANDDTSSYAYMAFLGTGHSYTMGVANDAEVTQGIADKWFLGDSGGIRMLLDTNGNFGIGTTTPNQAFSIFRNGADAAIEFSTISGSREKWTVGIDDSDAAKFKISSSSALGTSDRFVIDGSGNVGIGTASPADEIHLRFDQNQETNLFIENNTSGGTAQAGVRTRATGSSYGAYFGMVSDGAGSLYADRATVYSHTDMSGVLLSAASTQPVVFATNGTERGRFTGTGNFGIGTTTPSSLLTTYGTNPQLAAIESSTEFLRTGVGETAGTSVIGWDDADSLRLGVYDSPYDTTISSLMTILSSGNVGIGTTTPNLPLVVTGAGTAVDLLGLQATDASGYSSLDFFNNTGVFKGVVGYGNASAVSPWANNVFLGTQDSGTDIMLFTNTIERMRIDGSTGNVGIGTSTPNWNLQVASTNPYLALSDTNASAGSKHLLLENDGGVFKISTSSDSLASENTALSYNPSGSAGLGVGTSSPWRTLSIVGTAAINGLSAVSGTDYSVCIDNTTKELTTQSGDTCAVSALRFKHDVNKLEDEAGLDMLMRLEPVSYYYNNDTTNTKYWGLIADQAASTSRQLAYFNEDGSVQTLNTFGFLALFTKSMQELNLNLNAIASTSPTSTPASLAFKKSFFERVAEWLGDTTNGIKKIYAKRIETERLCVGDVCVDESTFLEMVQEAGQTAGPADPEPVAEPQPEPNSDQISPTEDPTPEPEPTPVPAPEPELEVVAEETPVS